MKKNRNALDANFIEGMACVSGCIGGAGNLTHGEKNRVAVDKYGHEAGDRLIRKAAESLKRIEARNIIPFRVGGDEFIVIAIHVSREDAEKIGQRWTEGLAEINRAEESFPCRIACGFAYGEKGFDLEEILALADRLMYEDKKADKEKDRERL